VTADDGLLRRRAHIVVTAQALVAGHAVTRVPTKTHPISDADVRNMIADRSKTFASDDVPLLGLYLRLDMPELQRLTQVMAEDGP